ncbi:MAG TPA: NADH-quinone oxidoreductase subunit H [bacterium]|nr:NADH-quinone oxidoreductase subunit H [bacterium]
MNETLQVLFSLFIFPGLFGMVALALLADWVDRKVYARVQQRVGPMYTGKAGILQPLADVIKLLSKEDITPGESSKFMFNFLPLAAFAAVMSAALLLPIGFLNAYNSFPGDLLIMLYLLGLPTLVYFLAGWHSHSYFGMFGGVRAVTQLFAYEVPFLLAVLTPALLTGSWQLSEISRLSASHPLYLLAHLLAFTVAILGLQAKLERVPFDIPEAETEIVGGPTTEYSGRKLAVLHLTHELMFVVGSATLASIFLGGFGSGLWQFPLFLVKTFAIIFILSLMRAAAARMRIDQLIEFSWKYLAPMSCLQFLFIIVLKVLEIA